MLRYLSWLFFVIFVMVLFVPSVHAETRVQTDTKIHSPRILFLNSYHKGYIWSDTLTEGFTDVFSQKGKEGKRIKMYIEYMDTKHHATPLYFEKLRSLYEYKFKDIRFDLIIISDDNALDFFLTHGNALFHDTQVIFCGVNNHEKMRQANTRGMIGIFEEWSAKETIDLALQFFPKTRHLAILADKTITGKAGTARIRLLEPDYRGTLIFHYIPSSTLDEAVAALKKLPPNTVILHTIFLHTDSGERVPLQSARNIISENTDAPEFVISDDIVLPGTIGGFVVSGYYTGKATGELARKILFEKILPKDIPENQTIRTPMFDYTGLRTYKIKESQLPPNSRIINTPTTFYLTYKKWIWLTALFILLETILLILFAINRAYRKKAQAEQLRLVAALEQSETALAITDTNGKLLFVNSSFTLFHGIKSEAVLHTPIQDVAPLFNREELWHNLSEETSWQEQVEHTIAPDTVATLDFRASVTKDAQGKKICYLFNHRDISREITLEDQLHQAQKMEAVGQLAGGIAHDFNNLLQIILGYTSKILENTSLDADEITRLHKITNASKQAASLVRQLLIFSRRDIRTSEPLDLNELINEVLKLLKRTLGEQIILDFTTNPRLPLVQADPSQIHQIIMNLCVNARDAMPDGGTIKITTEQVVIDADFVTKHPWARQGRFVCIVLKDTGVGMDAEIREHMFEPFFTTKATSKGTGIGLATVYGIVKSHDGLIHVESTPGKGTTFFIYIPSTQEIPPTVPRIFLPDPASTPDTARAATLLVAEDDEMVRTLSEEVLEDAGYTVISAVDGDDAIEKFMAHQKELDLIMLDVIMPHKTGTQVWEKIYNIRQDLPVLFSSGYSFNELDADTLLSKNGSLIQKPYTPKDLLETVAKILAKPRTLENPLS